jgi:hypothetical protein
MATVATSATVAARPDINIHIDRQSLVGKMAHRAVRDAAVAQLARHVGRYILRPFLGSVESYDPGRALVLAF